MNFFVFARLLLFGGALIALEAKETIEIVSYASEHYPPEFNNPTRYKKLKENFQVIFRSDVNAYAINYTEDDPNLHKIVFIDLCVEPAIAGLPKKKLICFMWEAHNISPTSPICNYYDRIYTFNDLLIDNQKFFKYHYPVLVPMTSDIPTFNEKNLCVMMVSHWLPERVRIVDFFANKPKDLLHVYGRQIYDLLPQYSEHHMIRGEVPGWPSSTEKLDTLKKYRFCLCFENSHNVPGYITEKIFDAFAAGCVPVYWGSKNTEQYIPSNCFIDYRRFRNNREMLDFLISMQEDEYNLYIKHIKEFLGSSEAQKFSIEAFEELLYESIKN